MICLGIESTAHTFGIGIVQNKTVIANEKKSYQPEKGGLHPRKTAEHHAEVCGEVLEKAINKSGIRIEEIDLIAFSQGPGLPPCLKIGAVFARTLAKKLGKPLIGVNHCVAHLEIGKLFTNAKDPVLLYASGANTQVIALESGKYRVFGETIDVGVGNMLDTFGRNKGLSFPAGPEIERLAKKGEKYVELPYTVKGMDLAFGGILTQAERVKEKMENVCHSLQETVFAMLIEVSERAMSHTQKKELILGGGVAANKRLNDMCKIMCEERGAKFYTVPKQYCVDNAAMIAWTGLKMHKSGVKTPDTRIIRNYRTDMVKITWK
ncbi:MAG: bifunctional N(6)-L-threonylcarbamoyladenine synthase/serine/threonine protein kinase [Nanoarchaeota archaeon]|nr:bifunctional N(6)-L-threonylcarbamoyladenine synthase/serine/threonine protein kinase [Nanoarchaeota archaeon]